MNDVITHQGQRPIRALGMLSGGLDSILAVRMLQNQGIEVECVNFYTGFCVTGHTQALRSNKDGTMKQHDALAAAEQLGVKLHIEDISEDYVEIVTNPRYGYGKNVNPCLDCKIFMVQKAKQMMETMGFDFVFTGEVLGERPMSQRRDTFPVIERDAEMRGWLLRPLSAQLLPETEPEKKGWVDRSKLGRIGGRSRKPQLALVRQFDIKEFPQPAGGCCFLTDENYARRLKDMWQVRGSRRYTMDDIVLLKVGRHLRINPQYKLIVGREEGENHYLQGYSDRFDTLRAEVVPGPVVLVDGNLESEEEAERAMRITARFGKGRGDATVAIVLRRKTGEQIVREVAPLPAEEVDHDWYL
ncbi:MAG: tRNA (5-methylaminomethyl-2-thiouridylate)-methyltransferase [Alphaproteobacteria bacterium CG_4_10_14_0_2_um_filter_63_37]|nr:MAG: tRNA (5-methylaminomethyl-2-thiouridylate)-methyltransferase [Proteobacteria bacterium CG1_02_64_396]PJA24047.1 MAG: tRNA (5-methylaminomethyl-2-thiouridylate)-methyltransferase [Alphaproteobacteria bacterium CG_4_10_14_0_2_um_filter_63_37]